MHGCAHKISQRLLRPKTSPGFPASFCLCGVLLRCGKHRLRLHKTRNSSVVKTTKCHQKDHTDGKGSNRTPLVMGITEEEGMRPRNTGKGKATAVHPGRRTRLRLRSREATVVEEVTDSLQQHPAMEIIRYVLFDEERKRQSW